MIIIALRGIGSTGKSSAIWHLHDQLMPPDGFVQIANMERRWGDIVDELTKNGKRIGMAGMGDHVDFLEPRIDEFQQNKCDVVVCACRSRGGTNELLRQYGQVVFLEKTREPNQARQAGINQQDAQRVLQELNRQI